MHNFRSSHALLGLSLAQKFPKGFYIFNLYYAAYLLLYA